MRARGLVSLLVLLALVCGCGPRAAAPAPIENRPEPVAEVPDAAVDDDGPSCEDVTAHLVALGAGSAEQILDTCRHAWTLSVRRCVMAASSLNGAAACYGPE